jgi:hypothetical protein
MGGALERFALAAANATLDDNTGKLLNCIAQRQLQGTDGASSDKG